MRVGRTFYYLVDLQNKQLKGLLWFRIHRSINTPWPDLYNINVKLLHRIHVPFSSMSMCDQEHLGLQLFKLANLYFIATSPSAPAFTNLIIFSTSGFCDLHLQYSLAHLALDYGNSDRGIRAFHGCFLKKKSDSCSFHNKFYIHYPDLWGRANSELGELVKAILNFFTLWNSCH